jgi:hypothetical protein
MLKYLSILATLIAVGTSSANAQQREAIFQKIEVPNASFDIVLATAKPGGPILDFRDQADPNVVYLGNDLVTAYTAELAEMLDVAALMRPARAYFAERGGKKGLATVLVYIVPKREVPNASAMR